MKHGSDYAKRIRRLYHELVKKHGKPVPGEPSEPIDQMLIGILALDSSLSKAQAVYRRLRQQTVDLNELRVTPAIELAQMIGDGVPLAELKARRIVDALNAVRRRQDTLDLSFLRLRGRREAREYLESLHGVGPVVAAYVVLLSLGGHAIPVDNLTLYVLRKESLVDGRADAAAVQGFLERCINASEAGDFTLLLNRHVSAYASRVDLQKLPALLNPSPAAAPPPPVEPAPAPADAKAAAKEKGKIAGKTDAKTDAKAKTPVSTAARPAVGAQKKK
jgi:endonuclease III